MSDKFMFVALLIWSAFLVLIGTFGGQAGADAAGGAGAATVCLVVLYGIYRFLEF